MKQLLFLLLLAGFFQSRAQVSVGLRAGSHSSSYWKNDDPEGGNRLLHGIQFGAVAEMNITEAFGLRAELNYVPKGDAWYFDYENGFRENLRDVYHYLEIPILAKYKFQTDKAIQPYLIGGLYAARALSNKYTENGHRYKVTYTKGDFGLQLGGGASMPFGPGQLFAEFRFSQGFKNLDAFLDEDSPTRLSGFGLGLGWMIPVN